MHLYRVCELTLASTVPLPELPVAQHQAPDCLFNVVGGRTAQLERTPDVQERRLPDGQPWLLWRRRGSEYILRFPKHADFILSAGLTRIECRPVADTPFQTIKHLLLNQVIPMVLHERGNLVLHASAVVAAEGAVAFMGETGAGKSTLAGSFCGAGAGLVTDDCLLLRENGDAILGVPSYPGVRLWPDAIDALALKSPALFDLAHYTQKKRVGFESACLSFCDRPVPILAAFVLVEPDESTTHPGASEAATVTRLSGRDGFVELLKHSFRLDPTESMSSREFERLSRVAARLPVSRLMFPREYAVLSQVRRSVRGALRWLSQPDG